MNLVNTWVSSDWHFGHQRILEFCPNSRKFKDVDEMNEFIINTHNNYVKPEDEFWFLGDYCFKYDVTRATQIFNRLNGHKKMLRGNHDKVGEQLPWEEVTDYKRLTFGNQRFVLFHFPIAEWDGQHRDTVHLHGHIHSDWQNPKIPKLANRYDVGWDNYQRPVNLNEFKYQKFN